MSYTPAGGLAVVGEECKTFSRGPFQRDKVRDLEELSEHATNVRRRLWANAREIDRSQGNDRS